MPVRGEQYIDWVQVIIALTAIIALIQPWVISFIQKKRANIDVLPNKKIDIGFNKRGIYILAFISLISKHAETVISNLTIKIIKDGNMVYNLEWDLFFNPYTNWYTNGEQSVDLNSLTYAHQIYLNKDKPELFKMQFVDFQIEKRVQTHLHNRDRDNLLLQCKLEPGKYDLIFEVKSSNSKPFRSEYEVDFSVADIDNLQANIDNALNNQPHNQIKVSISKKNK